MKINFYHGTKKESAIRIKNMNKILPSMGDGEWLGDGVYFFDKEFHAYKWIERLHDNYYKKNNKRKYERVCTEQHIKDVFKRFTILISCIEIDDFRILDMDDPDHRILYDRVLINVKKQPIYTSRMNKQGALEHGVILNIMFNSMGDVFKNKYYIVKAQFPKNKSIRYIEKNNKLGFPAEIQYCVKDINKVLDDIFFNKLEFINDNDEKIKELNEKIKILYSEKIVSIGSIMIYTVIKGSLS